MNNDEPMNESGTPNGKPDNDDAPTTKPFRSAEFKQYMVEHGIYHLRQAKMSEEEIARFLFWLDKIRNRVEDTNNNV